ncbi:Eco57I restriction-modification methylase domain-containing protein [Nocardia sp. CA-084685]|uniref:Eco57I restriction-modification methylase domain-containing protein n=1 Tax=Nocardia sp. CA-084685 TaxID=3239970 RepID=UPI003D9811D5
MRLDSLVNRGDYFSAHYLAEVLPKDLKKKDGLLARWAEEEKQHRQAESDDSSPKRATPRQGLRALGKPYFADRPFFADLDARRRDGEPLTANEAAEQRKKLHELHGDVLRALGFDAQPRELSVERAGREHTVPVAYADDHLIAIECGWAVDVDAALDDDQAGKLLDPVQLDNTAQIRSASKLAKWLFADDTPPRYVLILAGGVVILADRATWSEARYLGVSLDIALGRNDIDELSVIAALFGADSLLPPAEGGSEPLADLLNSSRNHAVGVSKELRDGLKESVELIANEVLDRIRAQGARPEDIMEPAALAKELGRESLRYLYRILFLLYAEARPELGILPTDDQDYGKGYSLARLGDLVVRDLGGEESRNSLHLYESLDLLFRLVNAGHRPRTGHEISEDEGLRFEPMRSDLFELGAIGLIRKDLPLDDDEDRTIDTRLRNACLYQVLRKLMLAKGRRKERGGFISYAQLGINQLGAVYEGLMSYTGFIATEDLLEVAKNGDSKDGSWMIPASKETEYPAEVFVPRVDDDGTKTEEYVRYPQGSFVYRLAGRDRETSASYYTPESLTSVTVQLALKYRLDQDGTTTTAREILGWRICEPALGSGAFLNEAINQVAAEYLKRRMRELGTEIDSEQYDQELQKAKAYIALHNSYGVDLNETAVELAEVSLWLNVMHPGLQAPWFGLHLRRGNSLIGAGRKVYTAAQLTKGEWLGQAPEDLPFSAGALPAGRIHHFLVPADGWGAVAGAKEAKALAPEQAKQLGDWRRGMKKRVSDKKTNGRKLSQVQRLQALSGRVEYLWDLVIQRLTISEREISRKIDVWGADWLSQPEHAVPKEKVYQDLTAPGTPYWRLKKVMDAWCALWFWPLDKAGLLDGTDAVYASASGTSSILDSLVPEAAPVQQQATMESTGFEQVYVTESLFGLGDEQLDLAEFAQQQTSTARKRQSIRRPKLESVRAIIPLQTLDDWLDFSEAVLGRTDVPEDSLVTSFESLADLEYYEDQLPVWMGMDSEFKLGERFPWLGDVENIAEDQGFFHWELQFAQIFNRFGFDLQVGNPPWVRPTWKEDSVLAELDPWFMLSENPDVLEWADRKGVSLGTDAAIEYFAGELSSNWAVSEFIGGGINYPTLAGTQLDLYRGFMCRVWDSLGRRGTAGLIHPDTHFTGTKEGVIRARAYHHLRLHSHFVNERILFDILNRNEFGIHIYGRPKEIDFAHLSWIFAPETLIGSLDHPGDGDVPGIKNNGIWDIRPHSARIIRVNESVLTEWQTLLDADGAPVDQTQLLYPVSSAEVGAINALIDFDCRIVVNDMHISYGLDEAKAKKEGLIRWNTARVDRLDEVVLQGPHFVQATPFGKQPNIPCRSNRDWSLWNLSNLANDAVPATNYVRAVGREEYVQAQDTWGGRKSVEYYRLAWRVMMRLSNERSLFAALIPPGPAHVDLVNSLALSSNRETVLVSGFWATLPLDYRLRIAGRKHLRKSEVKMLPSPDSTHPLAVPLLLRTMRLNCLTDAYVELWDELFDPDWVNESWATEWPGLRPIGEVGSKWCYQTPLRTERERRAALVELDALVSVWLGMTEEQLVAIYRSRFPVLLDYEAQIWHDANGRKIAGDHNTFGCGQTKEHFKQLMAHLDPEVNGPVPDGYSAPFYKTVREAEYRQAHAVFADRMRQAGWPVPGAGTDQDGAS